MTAPKVAQADNDPRQAHLPTHMPDRDATAAGDAFIERYCSPELLSSDTVNHDRLVKAMNPGPSPWRQLVNAYASGPLRDAAMAGIGGLWVAVGFVIGVWATHTMGLA